MQAHLKQSQPAKYFDRLFAPSSCLAIITTISTQGAVNAAAFGTCARVHHNPVYIAFCTTVGTDTATNVLETSEFVINLPQFERETLEKSMVVGLPFASKCKRVGQGEVYKPTIEAREPPRIVECPRHFECSVEWTKEWEADRMMVCGRVIAASVDSDCVDQKGYILWDRVKPAHYCGAPYGSMFVPAYEATEVLIAYSGPEVDKFQAERRAMFEDI